MWKKEIDGIEINEENIITSLKIIKQVCESNYNDCRLCPFSICSLNDDSCICKVATKPNQWSIQEYKKFQALG